MILLTKTPCRDMDCREINKIICKNNYIHNFKVSFGNFLDECQT